MNKKIYSIYIYNLFEKLQWNHHSGDTLGTKATVPWMEVGLRFVSNQPTNKRFLFYSASESAVVNTVNPLLSPLGGLFTWSPAQWRGWEVAVGAGGGEGLIEMGVLFNLEKATVSVIHKVEKLKYKKGGGNAVEDQNQNHPGSVRD